MRLLFILFILPVLIFQTGCHNSTSRSDIEKFETAFGEENSIGLSLMVQEFEKTLLQRHKTSSVSKAYQAHLESIQNIDVFEDWLDYQQRRDSFFISVGRLEPDEFWFKPDTVELVNGHIVEKYYHTNSITGELTRASRSETLRVYQNPDSVMNLSRQIRKFNMIGKWMYGLTSIEDPTHFVAEYIDAKEAAGDISLRIDANAFLHYKPDYNDYMVKRIILVETFY